jgi:hypothetical protein
MKIWLDDLRPAPWGYESARSVNEAKTLIREAERNGIEIEVLDLDHDLGDFASQGGDAIKLLDWLAGDLLPCGDPYRESSGQSEYGERAGEVLGRGVLVRISTVWARIPATPG